MSESVNRSRRQKISPANRGSNWCSVALFLFFLFSSLCIFIASTYAEVSSSSSFQLDSSTLNEGGGRAESSNFVMWPTSIGDTIGFVTSSAGGIAKGTEIQLQLGFVNVLLSRISQVQHQYDITEVWAKTDISGSLISEKIWQKDATSYFYWQKPSIGLPILGYSVSFDLPPDDVIDITSTGFSVPAGTPLSDGIHTFYVKAQNTAGNWGAPASFELWIDTIPPKVTDFLPREGSISTTDKPTISAQLFDVHSGINENNIVMKVNNNPVIFTYTKQNSTLTYTPLFPLADGSIVVYLNLTDIAGNSSFLTWSFIIDRTPPYGTIVINNNDELTNSIYVDLTLQANDKVTAVTQMSLSNDGMFDTEVWETYSTTRRWILPPVNGIRTVYVKYKDTAGNESEYFTDSILLSIIAPDTVITSGPSGITDQQKAIFSFASSEGDASFSTSIDGKEWSVWDTKNSVSFDNLPFGNHYFKVKAGKDLNRNGVIELQEEDPTPAQRSWTIIPKLGLPIPPQVPIKYWKVE